MTCRLISPIEDDSSSAALATVWTLTLASSDAADTASDWRVVSSALLAIACAIDCMPAADVFTVASTEFILPPNSLTATSTRSWRFWRSASSAS